MSLPGSAVSRSSPVPRVDGVSLPVPASQFVLGRSTTMQSHHHFHRHKRGSLPFAAGGAYRRPDPPSSVSCPTRRPAHPKLRAAGDVVRCPMSPVEGVRCRAWPEQAVRRQGRRATKIMSVPASTMSSAAASEDRVVTTAAKEMLGGCRRPTMRSLPEVAWTSSRRTGWRSLR